MFSSKLSSQTRSQRNFPRAIRKANIGVITPAMKKKWSCLSWRRSCRKTQSSGMNCEGSFCKVVIYKNLFKLSKFMFWQKTYLHEVWVMKYSIAFGIFTSPYLQICSAVFLVQNEHSFLICRQSLISPRHAFLEIFFTRKVPVRERENSPSERFKYYNCSEEEIKLLQLARRLSENSSLWHKLQRKLLQNCDLQELIHFLEICVLTEKLGS